MKSIAIITLLCFLILRGALAQTNEAFQRTGFLFGLSVGAGIVNTSIPENTKNTQIGTAYNWRIGAMINPKLALMLQGTVSTYKYEGNVDSPRERLRGFEGLIPSVLYFINDKQWVSGGIGLGMDNPVFYDVKDESEGKYYAGGYKISLNSGYEVWQRKNKAIDIQGRFSYGTAKVPEGTRESFAFDLLIGFNFY